MFELVVHHLEFGLQVFVLYVEILDFLVALQVLLDLEGHQELRQVGSFVAFVESGHQEVDHGVYDAFISVNQAF